MTPTPPAQESSTHPPPKPAGRPRAKSGRRAKAKRSAKAARKPAQQAFVFEGLPSRSDKAKPGSSKRTVKVTNTAALRAGADEANQAAAKVNYVQQELDLGA